MYESHSVGVVIPAYNEAEFIGDVIRDVPEYVDRLYVVDDCSVDDTPAAIRAAAKADAAESDAAATEAVADGFGLDDDTLTDRVAEYDVTGRTIAARHEENLGAGGAIKTGFLLAIADGVDVVATIDADGQMDTSKLWKFLDPIVADDADYAKGDRLSSRDHWREMPRFRLFGNGLLTLLTRVATGYWDVTDPQNGYTAIRVETLERVDVDEMYEYYGYLNDLLVRLKVADARVADVALPAIYDDETSHIRYKDYVVNVSRMLLRDYVWRLRNEYPPSDGHPVVPLFALGAAAAGVGTVRLARSLSPFRDDDDANALGVLGLYAAAATSFLLVVSLDWAANRRRGSE